MLFTNIKYITGKLKNIRNFSGHHAKLISKEESTKRSEIHRKMILANKTSKNSSKNAALLRKKQGQNITENKKASYS